MLGDVNGGYNYNALLQSQTLSFMAVYGYPLTIAVGVGLVAYLMFFDKKSKRHRSE